MYNYIHFIHIFIFTIYLLIISHSEDITFCYKGIQCYELNDKTFKQKWNTQLTSKFNNVTHMRIHDLKISQSNFITLFSHPLPKLTKIIFWNHNQRNPRKQSQIHHPLTPIIIQTIFTSTYFSQLQELDLAYTNIQFRHFNFLNTINRTITSNLKILYLIGNFLQKKAFNLLSKINFQGKLQTIAMAENSLMASQTIDSLLKIIASPDGGKSQLRNLTVYNTAITTDNIIRLLDNIDTSKMTNLNIALNPFQHTKSYKIPFNNTFYEYLSGCNFSRLRRLCMNQLDLDNEQLPYLKKMRLPQLQILQVNNNFITDQYFKQWITKQNIPKLRRLSLRKNSITDNAIKLLVNHQFQKLAQLYLAKNKKLTPRHLQYLAQLNTSKWTHLQLSQNSVFQKSLKLFFQNKSFENLQQFTMIEINDAFKFFQYFPWQSMKKLDVLQMILTDFSWSVDYMVNSNMTFPSLKIWKFGGAWLTSNNLIQLTKNLTHFGPQLELVEIIHSQINQGTAYFNISNMNIQTIPKGMILTNLNYLSIYRPYEGDKYQILQLVFGDRLGNNFIGAMFHYSFFDVYLQSSEQMFSYILLQNQTQINMVCEWLQKIAIFQNLSHIGYEVGDDFQIIKRLLFKQDQRKYAQQYNKFINKSISSIKATVYLPYLKNMNYIALQATQNLPNFMYYMLKLDAPLFNSISIGAQYNQHFTLFVNKILKRYENIKGLILPQNQLDCEMMDKIFDGVRLPFLRMLDLRNNQIEKQCLAKLLQRHPLIRDLSVNDNFLQKGLFDQILAKNQIILGSIQFSNMQISNQQFSKLSLVNTQFMTNIQAYTIDVNSDGIKWLVGNVTGRVFPKCQSLNLGNNNVNQQGVKTLLQSGMPFIKFLYFVHVTNPNLINNMFSYPNHYAVISVKDANIYGLDPNLDPRSTRHVQTLQLHSPSLTLQDYETLSKLNFINLSTIGLLIQNIYECEILKYILTIVQDSDKLIMTIMNEKIKGKTLNDKCLPRNNPSQIYMPHLTVLQIYWSGQYYYIPSFYSYFYSQNQLLDALFLANSLIKDQIFTQIVQNANLQHLWVALLMNNLLTSQSVKKLFIQNFTQLKQLELGNNYITSDGLSTMVGKQYPQLVQIGLQLNQIDDKGIQYLIQASFPKLMMINLANNDITKIGFAKLFEMNAPRLTVIDISNCQLTDEDLIWVMQRISIQKFPSLNVILTTIRMSSKNTMRLSKIMSQRFQRVNLEIQYQPYYLQLVNKAIIEQS